MKLTMQLGSRSYGIILKSGCLANLYQFANVANRKVFILTDSGVPEQYAQTVLAQCPNGMVYTVPQGEASKSLKVYGQVLQAMLEFNMTRKDLLVAVGGGVVGDLGGFCAASYMRGIDFINCPTTTLSMIDSSIGGKTAVDLGDTKNIVGAFWQPKLVIVDPATLSTLPRRHFINGLAEAVKAGLLADPELFSIFEKEDVDDRIGEIICRSLRFKKNVVEQDETERGMRKALNFGHTIGHAVERYFHYSTFTHGEGVAMGMSLLTEQTEKMGLTEKGTASRLIRVLRKLSLPTSIGVPAEELIPQIMHDKKRRGKKITLVVLKKIGACELLPISTDDLSRYVVTQ